MNVLLSLYFLELCKYLKICHNYKKTQKIKTNLMLLSENYLEIKNKTYRVPL